MRNDMYQREKDMHQVLKDNDATFISFLDACLMC